MRTEVTDAEVESYREQGFVVIEGLLDSQELDQWRDRVTRAVADRASSTEPHNVVEAIDPENLPDEMKEFFTYYLRVFDQRINLWQTDAGVRELVIDPRIGRMAATLAGVDGIRLFHDQALFKPAWGNPTGFHLDVPYWSFRSTDALSIWVALDDATPQNGCLSFIPGSHKSRKYENVTIGKDLGALFDLYPEWTAIEPVQVPMAAGSASFHNALTAHGANANLTHQLRRAMTMQFMPEGATYNGQPNILPPEYVATLSHGDLLDNEEVNPLLWSRNAAHQLSQ